MENIAVLPFINCWVWRGHGLDLVFDLGLDFATTPLGVENQVTSIGTTGLYF